MNRKKRNLLILITLAVVLLACLAALAFGVPAVVRRWHLSRMPLVMIASPSNHQPLTNGVPVNVSASARSAAGIARLELWVDSALLVVEDYSTGEAALGAALDKAWSPRSGGRHTLVAVAYTPGGIKGQGSIVVQSADMENSSAPVEDHTRLYFVQEGDTLAAIAAESGTSSETLQALNPGLPAGEPAAGDALVIPPASPGAQAADGLVLDPLPQDNPPDPEPGESGIVQALMYLLNLGEAQVSGVAEPETVRLEALALQTGAPYEGLHCYISLAGSPERWYPDADHNQSTDESFTLLDDSSWDIAAHLGDGVSVYQPQDQPLPLGVRCVGIAGGGTDAIDLGSIALEIEPAAWDGVTRQAASTGGESFFTLDYRVVPVERHGYPIIIDFSMTPPVNLEAAGTTLTWDYFPRPDEEAIDGFKVYFNGTLLWLTDADDMHTEIAREWRNPPCGERNNFTVSAFRYGPDDPESPPSEPVTFPSPVCDRLVSIDFSSLITYDLSGLVEEDNSVGPVVILFRITHPTGSSDQDSVNGVCGYDDDCSELWLSGDSNYNVTSLISEYQGEYADNHNLQLLRGQSPAYLSFEVIDFDGMVSSRTVCEGSTAVTYDMLDDPGPITIRDGDGTCEVLVNAHLQSGPVGDSTNPAVLPNLFITDIYLRGDGHLSLDVMNYAVVPLMTQDLSVLVEPVSSDYPAVRHTFNDTQIAAGQEVTLSDAAITLPEHPLGVCVTLDPDNEILDWQDEHGGQHRFCAKLPDLLITDSRYDAASDSLFISLTNYGDAELVNADFGITLETDGGLSYPAPGGYQNISLSESEDLQVQLPLGGLRSELADGYSLVIDPDNQVAEKHEGNNTFLMGGSRRLRVTWQSMYYNEYDGIPVLPQEYEFRMHLEMLSHGVRSLADWRHVPPEYESDPYINPMFNTLPGNSIEFEIMGDEDLQVSVEGYVTNLDEPFFLGSNSQVFSRRQSWGVDASIDPEPGCTSSGRHLWQVLLPGRQAEYNPPWATIFTICRLE